MATIRSARHTLRPPPKLSLSEWADEHFRLSAGSADAGRWKTRPYQREILNAIVDPAAHHVSVIKSARIGWTQIVNIAIAYFMSEDPCSMLIVQPTVETAEIYSRELLAPMLRDVPIVANLVQGSAVKTTGRTLLHKTFPGGVLSMIGANSGAGFAMINRRVVAFDEVDRYPSSAGDEGDPIALGEKRAETFWNRKILAGSTPLIAGASRIEEMFEAGDRRRRYWPCPHCGHMDFLAFSPKAERGHIMRWPEGRPDAACFECRGNGCVIEERHKRDMDENGEWRGDGEFEGHASFSIWSAYSTSPNSSWGQIVAEFLAAKKLGPEKLRTVVNTTFGETWKERGEAPDWERLYQRREPYPIGTVPAGPVVLTAGVDVQKDRLVYEVVGWAPNKESWSVDAGELHGDTSLEAGHTESPWTKLDELLGRTFDGGEHRQLPIAMMAVDSGYNTQVVYGWCRQHAMSRVIATKGFSGARMLIGAPSPVDVTIRGRKMQRGYKVWSVGVDLAKAELYGWLRLALVGGEAPAGYCHFPEHADDFFKQLTAEHLVTVANRRTGRARLEWQVLPNRQNHWLDARILARAAAAVLGIDRLAPAQRAAPTPATPGADPETTPNMASHAAPAAPRAGAWLGKRPGGWLGRKR